MKRSFVIVAALAAIHAVGAEEDRFANVQVQAHHVAGAVHMLTGAGGNIGASIGADGTLVIDDQFAPLAEKISEALAGIGGARPKLVLNTHFHGDHTGSNATFGETGTIVAHDNVRVRLLGGTDVSRTALPLVTFSDRLRIYFNDDELDVMHLPSGHTDGDAVVWFRRANVVHMGDLFFKGRFPVVDLENGGTVPGYITALDAVLEWMPADARVIPGHGELATRSDLVSFRDTIAETLAIVRDRHGAGMSLDEIIAAGLGPQYAEFGSGYIDEARWIRILYAGVSGTDPRPAP